eukprot:CAMPEP_0114663066 /NCGR_PEP_ID=MMETSP0191-20121206/26188_1 /TAXON_ID=126664 /ORGANISM="Sorites sp." /LENGTH=131 /DNA_ID=CAMNT_0001901341 /DNA_START=85 /DNA_END=477 /DNA_ORIENTATION=+
MNACMFEPGGSSKVIDVGNYDSQWTRAYNSNYGDCIDTWAPGYRIYSSFWNGYGWMSGTSMSAPAISGLVGAMLLIQESITLDGIKQILKCNNCSYTREIMDAKSKNKYAFSYNCNQIESIFYGTQNTDNE